MNKTLKGLALAGTMSMASLALAACECLGTFIDVAADVTAQAAPALEAGFNADPNFAYSALRSQARAGASASNSYRAPLGPDTGKDCNGKGAVHPSPGMACCVSPTGETTSCWALDHSWGWAR
jgi:hypothetical protein